MKSFALTFAAFFPAIVVPVVCSAASYSVVDLGTLGGTFGVALGLNAKGQVTGQATTLAGAVHAFFYDGTMHDLGTFGGSGSAGNGINASGQIAGSAQTVGNAARHAFFYDGTMHQLGTFGGQNSEALGINASGQMTGFADAGNGNHAFLYDAIHGMVDLNTLISPSLGWLLLRGSAINDLGQITGEGLIGGQTHAFVFDGTVHDLGTVSGVGSPSSRGYAINASGQATGSSNDRVFLYDGTMHILGGLGGGAASGYGINANGQVTGGSYISSGSTPTLHAFVYDAAHGMVDLNSLVSPLSGLVLESGGAINDAGQIAGAASIGEEFHAFLLTPVPEPSSLVLCSLAFCAVAAYLSCRRLRRRAT